MFKFLIVLVFIESKTSLKFYAYCFFQTSKAVAQRCSVKKVSLEISQNSQEYICARAFFYKVAGLRPATLLKKRLWHWCFPANFTKFLRKPFSQNTSPLVTETFNKCFIRHLSLDVFNPVIPQSIQNKFTKKIVWSHLPAFCTSSSALLNTFSVSFADSSIVPNASFWTSEILAEIQEAIYGDDNFNNKYHEEIKITILKKILQLSTGEHCCWK